MFEFKVIEEIKPNTEIVEIIKDCTFIVKNGKVKHLLKTNLQCRLSRGDYSPFLA